MNDITSLQKNVDHERRFGGLARLYGTHGAENIFAAHVVVVGIGGVGSWSAEALARSGVGRITLIDMDHVSESNINRQIHALGTTIGQAKVEAMRDRIMAINPLCQVHMVDDFVTPENWMAHIQSIQQAFTVSAVIDACDQVIAKTAMAAWALDHRNIVFICIGAAGGKQKAHLVELDDLSKTTHDPLLAKMRYNLRRNHDAARVGKLGIACIYSKESIQQPLQKDSDEVCEIDLGHDVVTSDGSLNCHGYGSTVAVTATFGMSATSFVLESLAKIGKSKL